MTGHSNDYLPLLILPVMVPLAIWDTVWKLIAMWTSARHGQLAWYICLAIFNTVGILSILCLLPFQKTGARTAAPGT